MVSGCRIIIYYYTYSRFSGIPQAGYTIITRYYYTMCGLKTIKNVYKMKIKKLPRHCSFSLLFYTFFHTNKQNKNVKSEKK